MTHDYKRQGTFTLFTALIALEGRLIARTEKRHTHVEWLRFLKEVGRETKDLDIHLIQDNYATHKQPKVSAWRKRDPRFKRLYTPTSSSWMRLVGALLCRLGCRCHPDRQFRIGWRARPRHQGLSRRPQRQSGAQQVES
ncbi:MAG: transposase [Bradyrhizobium sp.]|nr:transposase [Acidobacteriota bacterium]MBV8916553.1 transposase [Bradyrhizobium sp.]MBV9982409.1 transposase [Bradyrhizobium sp.]